MLVYYRLVKKPHTRSPHPRFYLSNISLKCLLHNKALPAQTLQIFSKHIQKLSKVATTYPAYREAVITDSLFLAGQQAGMEQSLIMELANIFGWDVDFALDIRKNDSFKLLYEEQFLDGEKLRNGAILAAEFTNQGNTYKAVRYVDENGVSNYYTPEGRSSTPIKAAGDGKVVFAGNKSGYGKTVVIQHGQTYKTLYAHMNQYGKGIRSGKRVKQSQIIGYVGSTGLNEFSQQNTEIQIADAKPL